MHPSVTRWLLVEVWRFPVTNLLFILFRHAPNFVAFGHRDGAPLRPGGLLRVGAAAGVVRHGGGGARTGTIGIVISVVSRILGKLGGWGGRGRGGGERGGTRRLHRGQELALPFLLFPLALHPVQLTLAVERGKLFGERVKCEFLQIRGID